VFETAAPAVEKALDAAADAAADARSGDGGRRPLLPGRAFEQSSWAVDASLRVRGSQAGRPCRPVSRSQVTAAAVCDPTYPVAPVTKVFICASHLRSADGPAGPAAWSLARRGWRPCAVGGPALLAALRIDEG
jgi:hypothetical protein